MIKAADLPPIPDYSIAHPSPPAPAWKYPMPTQSSIELRDWFAGMAMQGAISTGADFFTVDEWAQWAYGFADAMLKAREAK